MVEWTRYVRYSQFFLLPSPYASSFSSIKIHLSSISRTCSSSYASRLTEGMSTGAGGSTTVCVMVEVMAREV